MLTAGLTGGLASGKTFVAEAFRELGARIIEADALGRLVMEPLQPAFEAVVAEFGTGILDSAGKIDRGRLAQIVFPDPAALARLNAIVHPAVREESVRRVRAIEAAEPRAVVIYVAAILVETNSAREFDRLIVATCSREQQIERALARGVTTEADIIARLDRQLPAQEKTRLADYIIDTSGSKAATLRQTKIVFEELRELA